MTTLWIAPDPVREQPEIKPSSHPRSSPRVGPWLPAPLHADELLANAMPTRCSTEGPTHYIGCGCAELVFPAAAMPITWTTSPPPRPPDLTLGSAVNVGNNMETSLAASMARLNQSIEHMKHISERSKSTDATLARIAWLQVFWEPTEQVVEKGMERCQNSIAWQMEVTPQVPATAAATLGYGGDGGGGYSLQPHLGITPSSSREVSPDCLPIILAKRDISLVEQLAVYKCICSVAKAAVCILRNLIQGEIYEGLVWTASNQQNLCVNSQYTVQLYGNLLLGYRGLIAIWLESTSLHMFQIAYVCDFRSSVEVLSYIREPLVCDFPPTIDWKALCSLQVQRLPQVSNSSYCDRMVRLQGRVATKACTSTLSAIST